MTQETDPRLRAQPVGEDALEHGRDGHPSWEMNRNGDPAALQSVLGWGIDDNNRAWVLDQGHIEGATCIDGAQKIVCWDITRNELVASIPVPHKIASYTASFWNDLVVDNHNGFVYIADSGIIFRSAGGRVDRL